MDPRRTADLDVHAAGQRTGPGIRISSHDLRRSFGRIAYHNRVPLMDLKYPYEHESADMTAHSIGLDMWEAARSFSVVGERMRVAIAQAGN